MTFLTNSILIATVLLSVFALGTSRVGMTIRIFAVQSFVIAALPWCCAAGTSGSTRCCSRPGPSRSRWC